MEKQSIAHLAKADILSDDHSRVWQYFYLITPNISITFISIYCCSTGGATLAVRVLPAPAASSSRTPNYTLQITIFHASDENILFEFAWRSRVNGEKIGTRKHRMKSCMLDELDSLLQRQRRRHDAPSRRKGRQGGKSTTSWKRGERLLARYIR